MFFEGEILNRLFGYYFFQKRRAQTLRFSFLLSDMLLSFFSLLLKPIDKKESWHRPKGLFAFNVTLK